MDEHPLIGVDLEYKPGLADVVERHRKLWGRKLGDGILARLDPAELPFDDPLQYCPHVQRMAAAWESNYRVRRHVEDDLIPVARVSFGSGAFGGFLGAKVSFGGGPGWSHPLLESYEQLDQLHYDPGNEWILRQGQACQTFLGIARGKFALCETEPMDGLNLVEVLRGGKVYLDVYDHPQELHQLLQFSVEFNIRLIDMQRQIIAPELYYSGGIFSMFRIWLPGETPWMSVDTYGQCSRAVFEEFGAPYLQQTIDHYGGGWIHLHSSATHLIPLLIQLKGVVGIGIYDDPAAPRGFDLLSNIRAITGDIPLQVDCQGYELINGLSKHSLPGGVMYMVRKGIDTIDQANRLMERVRVYHAPSGV
jgi:hypothetical protein